MTTTTAQKLGYRQGAVVRVTGESPYNVMQRGTVAMIHSNVCESDGILPGMWVVESLDGVREDMFETDLELLSNIDLQVTRC